MADFEPITPARPLKPLRDNARERGGGKPERARQRTSRRDRATDGERRDNDPRVDEYA